LLKAPGPRACRFSAPKSSLSVNVLRRVSQHHNVKLCDVGQKARTEHTDPA